MKASLPTATIQRVLQEDLGWHFQEHRTREIVEAIAALVTEEKLPDVAALEALLLRSGTERTRLVERFARRLSVKETSFYRDGHIFRSLEERILPDLIRRKRAARNQRLRIWSAGCCTGEEAYSLAIAVSRCLPAGESWDIKIFGTDLNADSIRRAGKASYGNWAFRGAPAWLKKNCFRPLPHGKLLVKPEFRKDVRFATHNLMDGLPAGVEEGALDLIFCRNVLMYFSVENSGKIVEKLRTALSNDGLLCVAPYESVRLNDSKFQPSQTFGIPFYHSSTQPASPVLSWKRAIPETAVARPKKVRPVRPRPQKLPKSAAPTARPAKSARPRSANLPQALPNPFVEARILAGEGKLWEALDRCDKLVAADRLDPEGHYLRATILLEGGRPDEAAQALRQALYLRPDHVPAQLALATVARNSGRDEEAGRAISRVREILSLRPADETIPSLEGLTAASLLAMLPKATCGVAYTPADRLSLPKPSVAQSKRTEQRGRAGSARHAGAPKAGAIR